MVPFSVERGTSPVILGQPHGGTYVPDDIALQLNDNGRRLRDTDWHIGQLYQDLMPDLTVVRANFHRYVIDANRDPSGHSLYPGQNTTGLVPLTDFDNEAIWTKEPGHDEVQSRLDAYHRPYHAALKAEIERVKALHGFAVLFDCHSIRSHIPFLFDGVLPALNIGTNNGATCDVRLEKAVLQLVADSDFSHVLNGRFLGGWTTRHYGRPQDHVHAVQMEIVQSAYLEAEIEPFSFSDEKAAKLRPLLGAILKTLAEFQP